MKNDNVHGSTGNTNAVSDNPKVKRLSVRCTPSDKECWAKAAGDTKLSAWITDTLNEAAKPK